MASQQSSIMDLSFESYDGQTPFGGLLLDQCGMHWEHDVGIDVTRPAEICSADVYTAAAPKSLSDDFITHAGIPDGNASIWPLGELSLFDDLAPLQPEVNLDLEDFLRDQQISTEQQSSFNDFKQESPYFDVDSLVDDDFTCAVLKEVQSPGSPDSGFSSFDSASSPGSVFSDETSPSPKPSGLQLPEVSPEDLSFIESLWQTAEQQQALINETSASQHSTHTEPILTKVVLAETSSLNVPAKAPIARSKKSAGGKASSKPTKSLTAEEKKERKRAQNKNAATRYREKKRAEANVIYVDQTQLEEKNKTLNDKVTLITREIEYMKELLIEVYKTKGLIE